MWLYKLHREHASINTQPTISGVDSQRPASVDTTATSSRSDGALISALNDAHEIKQILSVCLRLWLARPGEMLSDVGTL